MEAAVAAISLRTLSSRMVGRAGGRGRGGCARAADLYDGVASAVGSAVTVGANIAAMLIAIMVVVKFTDGGSRPEDELALPSGTSDLIDAGTPSARADFPALLMAAC